MSECLALTTVACVEGRKDTEKGSLNICERQAEVLLPKNKGKMKSCCTISVRFIYLLTFSSRNHKNVPLTQNSKRQKVGNKMLIQ